MQLEFEAQLHPSATHAQPTRDDHVNNSGSKGQDRHLYHFQRPDVQVLSHT